MSFDDFDKPEIITTAIACHYSYSETILICAAVGKKDEIKTLNILSKLKANGFTIQKTVKTIEELNTDIKLKTILKKDKDEDNFDKLFINKHFALNDYLKIIYGETYINEIDFEDINKAESEPSHDLFLSLVIDKKIIASKDLEINSNVEGITLKGLKLLVKGLSKDLLPNNTYINYSLLGEIVSSMVNDSITRFNSW